MIRPRYTIGQFMGLTAAAAAGLVAFRVWGPGLMPGVETATRRGLDRLRDPEVGLVILASLALGGVAFVACHRRAGRGSVVIESAYLVALGAALLLGGGDVPRVQLLMILTGLAYPTILGAGLGHWVAVRALPADRPAARLDDLLLALTVAPLLLVIPALAYEPLRAALARSGWLN